MLTISHERFSIPSKYFTFLNATLEEIALSDPSNVKQNREELNNLLLIAHWIDMARISKLGDSVKINQTNLSTNQIGN